MVIRKKNTNQRVLIRPTPTETIPQQNEVTSNQQVPKDINEIHQAQPPSFSTTQGETSISRPGFHFLNQSINNLLEERTAQREKAKMLKTEVAQNAGTIQQPEKEKIWRNLQSEMAINHKKIQKMRRKEKWMQAGISDHKQVQLGQKWLDNINEIQQMPHGPMRQLAQLRNQVNMMQQTQGITKLGTRLPIADVGSLNRHHLGEWLSQKIPSHVFTKSVVSILTQSTTNEPAAQTPTEEWLQQGHGGINISRLNVLSHVNIVP